MIFGVSWKMGNYGGYVWSSYGLTLSALLWLVFSVRRRWRLELERARRRARSAPPDQERQE